MSNDYIIQFGKITPKLSIPFLLALFLLFLNLLEYYFPQELDNQVMTYFARFLSQMSIIIIPKITFFSSKREQFLIKKKKACKSCCHFFCYYS